MDVKMKVPEVIQNDDFQKNDNFVVFWKFMILRQNMMVLEMIF